MHPSSAPVETAALHASQANTPPHSALKQAQQRGLQRLVQALFREGLLPAQHLIADGNVSWLPLWSTKGLLRLEGLVLGRIGNCQLHGGLAYYKAGLKPQPITTPAALMECIGEALSAPGHDLSRLLGELDNSLANDALCLSYRHTWGQQMRRAMAPRHTHFIEAVRHGDARNPALVLEQWGTLGHPWHPTFKSKLGLTQEEVMALSPEFQGHVPVQVGALHTAHAHVAFAQAQASAQEGTDYRQWFARTFPAVWALWLHALAQQVPDTDAWLPLPMHPFQAKDCIPHTFAAQIQARQLILLPQVVLAASPTMSFRTVVPEGSAELPHMKLPVSLRLTSVQRTVSPKSAVMGPRITQLLHSIALREGGFEGMLDHVGETVGLHYIDPQGDDDRARHLGVLFRDNPMAKRTDEHFPVPVGSLFVDSPLDGAPLAMELVALAYGTHAQPAQAFYTRYVHTVVHATLSAYLLYGIAFEAHQQNSFIMVNRRYEPVQLLVRDFGDLRVHAPTLASTGLALEAYRQGHTVFDDNEPVRDKLLHAVMLCHLSELGLLLARSSGQAEGIYWDILRDAIEASFQRLQPRTLPHRWQAERKALLEAPWPSKAFLRMRLSNTSDDVHGHMPNPLRAGPQ